MSDYEEDLDDFPLHSAANSSERAESVVGAYRAESTDQWAAASRITTKIPPLVNGLTSWFNYDEQIDDWLDLAALEVSKRGPAFKNRLVGDAEMYTGLLDREPLTAHDGVKFFKDTVRLQYVTGAQSFLWGFIDLYEQEEEILRWSSGSAGSHFSWSVSRMHGLICSLYPPWAKNKQIPSTVLMCTEKMLKDKEEAKKLGFTLKQPDASGTVHKWHITKGYFHSVITWQHWCSLLQVISVKYREKDLRVFSLLNGWMLLHTHLKR